MKKVCIIIIHLLIIICMITGCVNTNNIAKKQLYNAILSPNIQGVKEALDIDSSIVNKKMKLTSKVMPLELAVREIESEEIQIKICKALINAGANVNQTGKDNNTNLCWAIENERYQLAKILIDYGANVNKEGDERVTPLKAAVSRLSLKNYKEKNILWKNLLKKGAKTDEELFDYFFDNNDYGMEYYFAPKILKIISKEYVHNKMSQALVFAIKGENKKLQTLIKNNKVKESEKEKILAFAAAYCDIETLKLLKKQGYDIGWKDEDGVNLLQIAALCNKAEVVEFFLSQGLNGNIKTDYYQADAVSFAVLGGHLNHAKVLEKRGKVKFQNNMQDGECRTWSFLLDYGNVKSFETVLKLGYVPNQIEIFHGYENAGEDVFDWLYQNGYSINYEEDGEGLLCSASLETTQKFEKLCEWGLRAKESELNNLIWMGRSNLVRTVLEKKMYQGNIRKEVLLQSAINVGDFPMVKYLVKQGADINKYVKDETEDFSWTSLNMAYGRDSVEITEYLKEKGGDITKKDSSGRSCKDIAKETGAVWNLEK